MDRKRRIRWRDHDFNRFTCDQIAGVGVKNNFGRTHAPGWSLLLRQAPFKLLNRNMLTPLQPQS